MEITHDTKAHQFIALNEQGKKSAKWNIHPMAKSFPPSIPGLTMTIAAKAWLGKCLPQWLPMPNRTI